MISEKSVCVKTPKVSVLMPVFNTQESHLREAIESILSQTYTDFEFLILNDASTDANVERIVKSYDDSRIFYSVNEKNLGISNTRNRLIEKARGDYLAVVDHDDVSLPDRLAMEAAYLDEHPETGVVSAFIDIRSDTKNMILKMPESSDEIKKSLMIDCFISHPACMIRRSVLIDYNVRYESRYSPSEDYALFCRLINKTEFYNIQKVLLNYRNHLDNTSHLKQREMQNAAFAIQGFARRENPDLWDFARFNVYKKHRFLLFKYLKILKIEETVDRMDFYLFSCIPLFSIQKGRDQRK